MLKILALLMPLVMSCGIAYAGANEDLLKAAECGDIAAAQKSLNKGADVDTTNDSETGTGETALMLAAAKGHAGIVKLLIDKGADVNAAEVEHHGTALLWATESGHADIVKMLLDKDANVNAKNTDGTTALMLASGRGHVNIVELLLDKGADVNAKSTDGTTALMWATTSGHTKVVELLKAHKG